MSNQFQIEEMPGYIPLRFTGTCNIRDVSQPFGLMAEHCKRANKNKLLLDLTELHAEIFLADKYFLGENAQFFMRDKKVALVVKPEQLDPDKFCELVMRNRWIDARVFTNFEDAENWLSK